jgi:integrase
VSARRWWGRVGQRRRLHLVTPEPHREVELAVLVLATAVCARIDPTEWTPRELRHSFVSVLSDAGIPVEQIAQLVGHRGTTVTELVYRHQLRPVIQTGATVMDQLFTRTPERQMSCTLSHSAA